MIQLFGSHNTNERSYGYLVIYFHQDNMLAHLQLIFLDLKIESDLQYVIHSFTFDVLFLHYIYSLRRIILGMTLHLNEMK